VRYLLPAAGFLVAVGVLWVRRLFLVTTVTGTSMEPELRSGDRILVRRTKRVRVGQVVVFEYDDLDGARPPATARSRQYLIKRAAAVPGDRIPAGWEDPDVHAIAGTVVPSGSFVVLGDNRATSWDSRHHGFVRRDRCIGVAIRQIM
jgi:signal peptidase I